MKRDEILGAIKALAKSQGFYGRLLKQVEKAPEKERETFFSVLEAENFQDVVALCLFFEQ